MSEDHRDCLREIESLDAELARVNQERQNLGDAVMKLTQERDSLKDDLDTLHQLNGEKAVRLANMSDENDALREALWQAKELVNEVLNAGVEMEDERISYKTVQIDRWWYDDARKWVNGLTRAGGGDGQ